MQKGSTMDMWIKKGTGAVPMMQAFGKQSDGF